MIVHEPEQTTHWKSYFPSKCKFLGSHNLNPGQELVLTITEVGKDTTKDSNGNEEVVPIVKFPNSPPMILNKTNAKSIAHLYGDYTDDWVGKSIQIYASQVSAFGQQTLALRIRDTKPSVDIDISEYETELMQAKNIEELQIAFGSVPKHLRPKVMDVKNSMKEKLNEVT